MGSPYPFNDGECEVREAQLGSEVTLINNNTSLSMSHFSIKCVVSFIGLFNSFSIFK